MSKLTEVFRDKLIQIMGRYLRRLIYRRARGQTFHSLFRFLACAVVCYTQEDWVSSPSTQWHRKDVMPKSSLHVCIWSAKHQRYELQSHRHSDQWFHPGDEPAFTRWFEEHTSF